MTQNATSSFPNSTLPFPASHGTSRSHAGARDAAAEPAGGAEGMPAGGGAPRGRPSGCSDRVIAMIKDSIRGYGFSDSAAAEAVGVSSSTISRWKKQDPEIAQELLQARMECRIHHLEIVQKAAEAENGRGWRAAAWILERLFPGDYSPRMRERFAHRNFEDQRRDREDREALDEQLKELWAAQDAARAAKAATGAASPVPGPDAPASETDSHNSRNASESAMAGEPKHFREPAHAQPETRAVASEEKPNPAWPDALPEDAPAENSAAASETDSHNSRNSDLPGMREEVRASLCANAEPGIGGQSMRSL